MTTDRAVAQVIAVLSLAAIVIGCTPIRDNENVTDGVGDDPIVRDIATKLTLPANSPAAEVSSNSIECDKIGGNYGQQGLAGSYLCALSYSDAGKLCTKSTDCVGRCMAQLDENSKGTAPGKCEANTIPFGCFAAIDENGIVGAALCVD